MVTANTQFGKRITSIVNETALYVSEAALVVTTDCRGGKNLKERFLVKYGR
jgi:hypothetical protein